jgi:hypothetical protein
MNFLMLWKKNWTFHNLSSQTLLLLPLVSSFFSQNSPLLFFLKLANEVVCKQSFQNIKWQSFIMWVVNYTFWYLLLMHISSKINYCIVPLTKLKLHLLFFVKQYYTNMKMDYMQLKMWYNHAVIEFLVFQSRSNSIKNILSLN